MRSSRYIVGMLARFKAGFRQCPSCGSTWVRSSAAVNWRERKLLPLVMLKPLRCERCGFRFYGNALDRRLDHPDL
jgi:hypothetical protein